MVETFQIEVVTPERLVVNDVATEAQIPGRNGYMGILPGHAPLISELSVGEIAYRDADGKIKRLAVAWGFAEVLPHKITILAEIAERAEEIDVARAERAREQAIAALNGHSGGDGGTEAQATLQLAEIRIQVALKLNAEVANLVP